MTDDEFEMLVENCRDDLKQKIAAADAAWNLRTYTRFDFDQITGCLTFADEAGPKVVCTVQIVGTFSTTSRTWLWAWDSPWVQDNLKQDADAVREFGSQRHLERLTTRKWAATEEDGWDMTALAAHIAGAEGAYRLPNRESFIFMLLKRIAKAPADE